MIFIWGIEVEISQQRKHKDASILCVQMQQVILKSNPRRIDFLRKIYQFIFLETWTLKECLDLVLARSLNIYNKIEQELFTVLLVGVQISLKNQGLV